MSQSALGTVTFPTSALCPVRLLRGKRERADWAGRASHAAGRGLRTVASGAGSHRREAGQEASLRWPAGPECNPRGDNGGPRRRKRKRSALAFDLKSLRCTMPCPNSCLPGLCREGMGQGCASGGVPPALPPPPSTFSNLS